MKYFNSIVKIELPHEIINKAKLFAVEVSETTDYSDSNQFSKQKIIDDHFISKLGEEAANTVFSRYGKVNGPDYAVYHGKKKSWAEDLFIIETGLAVKTQKRTTAERFTLSWTFQAGPVRRDKILSNPESWVCFVEYDDSNTGNVCYVYPPLQVKELIFRDPILAKLKGHKLAVYAYDFKLK